MNRRLETLNRESVDDSDSGTVAVSSWFDERRNSSGASQKQTEETMQRFLEWMRVFSGASPECSLEDQIYAFETAIEQRVACLDAIEQCVTQDHASLMQERAQYRSFFAELHRMRLIDGDPSSTAELQLALAHIRSRIDLKTHLGKGHRHSWSRVWVVLRNAKKYLPLILARDRD